MSSPLETSVTLEEVLSVVATRRVPLAAELAGYLALEMAEGVGTVPGELDAANVYVSDEGTVALVRVRKDGDAEHSVRTLLARLLEAGGTQTPALGLAAKKAAGAGTAALSRELEAALIPVNRAAGRRALARLAREVKRITHGVGRNASVPPSARPDARRSSAGFGEHEAPTRPGAQPPPPAAAAAPAPATAPAPTAAPAGKRPPSDPAVERPPPAAEPAAPTDSLADAADDAVTRPRGTTVAAKEPAVTPDATKDAPAPPDSDELLPVEEPPADAVDELLSKFGVSDAKADPVVGRDLKAIVGVDPTPPPLTSTSPSDEEGASVEALLELSNQESASPAKPEVKGQAKPERRAPAAEAAPPKKPLAEARAPEPRAQRGGEVNLRSLPTAPSMRPPKKRSFALDAALGLVLAALLGAGGYLLYMRTKAPPRGAPPGPAPTAAPAPSAPRSTCKASLVVEGAPERAEVLLRVGQAPVEVEHMPVGSRLEFVATAEGHAPKRAVILAGAAWEKGEGGKPRYELAMQLDPSRAKGGVDPWPPAEPGGAGGEGPPGVVRVVATPKGAEVWLLVGVGPEAHIERLPCGNDAHVLVASGTTLRKRLVARDSDFIPAPGNPAARTAKISAR